MGVPSSYSLTGTTPIDREDFIIPVHYLVCQYYQEIVKRHPLRRRGFPPALSDGEVITIETCGEYFGFGEDEAIFAYFDPESLWQLVSNLKERTLLVRQAANLWQAKALIQQRLTVVSQQADDPIQPIDTLPLPMCVYTWSQRDRCFKPDTEALKWSHRPEETCRSDPLPPSSTSAMACANGWKRLLLNSRNAMPLPKLGHMTFGIVNVVSFAKSFLIPFASFSTCNWGVLRMESTTIISSVSVIGAFVAYRMIGSGDGEIKKDLIALIF